MANTDHPSFKQPVSRDIRLWRYMDFTKFVAMLDSSSLYFGRTDRFDDPYDGLLVLADDDARAEMYREIAAPKGVVKKIGERLTNVNRAYRRWTYVNCWHENTVESAAMWKLYARTDESVAVETDYQTLADALPSHVYLGQIRYLDYKEEQMSERNAYTPFMHKRRSFEHEREIRALFSNLPRLPDGNPDLDMVNDKVGEEFKVDISSLIKHVHVAPTAPGWFLKVVTSTASKFGYQFQITQSDLYSSPLL